MKRWQRTKSIKPCIDCGRECWGRRCKACHRAATAARPRPGLTGSWKERQRRARVVHEHRETYGDICPGWNRDPHPAADLTADHVIPVAAGGPEDGPLQVLCNRCNASKKDQIVDPRLAGRPLGDRQW